MIYNLKDNKPVYVISDIYSIDPANVQRRNKEGGPYLVKKLFPNVICEWEGYIKLICFILCMAPHQNRKSGSKVLLLS